MLGNRTAVSSRMSRRKSRSQIGTLNFHRVFSILLVIVLWHVPLSAQETGEDGRFYVNLSGSAVFPYDPRVPSDASELGPGYDVGTGFTAAFGYAFKEGFSTEMEWGYRRIGVGNSFEDLLQDIDLGGFEDFPGFVGGLADFPGFQIPSIGIEIDGELETQSLMGNAYYRYPEWRVSPYAGFGVGTFFHDGAFTSTFTVGNELGNIDIPVIEIPAEALTNTETYEDSRFSYQIMVGLSAQVSRLVEFRFGYRFRSSRGAVIDSDQIEGGIRFRF